MSDNSISKNFYVTPGCCVGCRHARRNRCGKEGRCLTFDLFALFHRGARRPSAAGGASSVPAGDTSSVGCADTFPSRGRQAGRVSLHHCAVPLPLGKGSRGTGGRAWQIPTGKADELPWKTLKVGALVWFVWLNDDAGAWEIGEEVVTAVGYEGFWYSGDLKNPLNAGVFVPWERLGSDVFLSRAEAELWE